ncbi:HEAT repeat domain-containing protein [Stenotrophomonas sp. YIM B06876]|uniref:HEAT repeat domain-containing protein n=1 Tax=Stenotrophomonas sp. YIM B06876 TaxID=3060211 RepID=UPI002738E396|nr:HEAT repeat domain-containing protein [Stenotrophomonas sp. YIM B06876]
MMEYLFNGAPEVRIALWVALATLAMVALLLASILLLRVHTLRRERRDAQARQTWAGLFQRVLDGEQVPVRPVRHGEIFGFVEAWNAIHEPLSDADSRRLIAVGKSAGLVETSKKMLHGGYHSRAMAIVALGYLRDRNLFDLLSPWLTDRSPVVSLCAARALSQIDPPRAMAMFVPAILERDDWVEGSVAQILAENHDGSALRELAAVLPRVEGTMAVKLVGFLADIDPVKAGALVRQLLEGNVDDRVLSACLRVVTAPQDRERVRQLLTAERWHVRMNAATALGRIGEQGDVPRLEPLLCDAVWWVRYRAAQALLALPGVGAVGLQGIRARQSDSYGRDIIDQVLSEQGMRSAT